MSEAAWNKAFNQGSSALKKRLMDVHAKNPKFQTWLKSSGHGAGSSVKQASKEIKQSERAKSLQTKSLKAYGATKGLKVGGEYGSGEMKDTIKPLTRDQHSKVQAAERAAKAAAKASDKAAAPKREPIKSKEDRLNFLKKTFSKAKSSARQARFDVATLEKNRDHDDLRDVHDALHISGVGSKYSVDENLSTKNMLATKIYTPAEIEALNRERGTLPGQMTKKVEPKKKPQTTPKETGLTKKSPYDAKKLMKYYGAIGDFGHKIKDTKSKGKLNRFEEIALDEITKQEAEKVLGGEVKEKPKMAPGKQPAGYRYVRSLARKAMKAGMKKEEVVLEEPKHSADVGEYDYEGDMAKSQLRSILANAKRMHDMLEDNTNLPEWVQSKITLAEDYILTAANYMEGEMNEGYGGKFPKEWQKEMEKVPSTSTVVHKDKTVVTTKKDGKVVDVKTTKNEEIEQIDELKKSTLASYVNKAANQVRAKTGIAASFETQGTRKKDPEDYEAYMDAAKDFRQGAKKRLTGIEKATAKLAKEEVETVEEKYENNPLIPPRPNKAVGLKPSQLAKKPAMAAEAAEGSVPTTPKEKALAAHHGDPKKITYGDVIKARLKSAAAKKMGK